jgi:hypothetical protein
MINIINIFLVLFLFGQAEAGQGFVPFGYVGSASAPTCTKTVEWDMTATGLDCYDATDGATTTTSSVTFSAEGAEFNSATDYASFVCTDGNNINKASYKIGFKYKQTGTVPEYAFLYEHDYATKAIALIRNGTSNTEYLIYTDNIVRVLTSTVNLWNGTEHTMEVVFSDSENTISISIDGETPVSTAEGNSPPAMSSGNLYLCSDAAHETACGGIMSDFYIE